MNKRVELFAPTISHFQEFEIDHAERILVDASTRKTPTWELSEKSKKKYDFVNGKLIARSNKGTNKKASKKNGD